MSDPNKQTTGKFDKNTEQAAAHLKRSWEMANDSLFKEAVILWEHANRISPTPLDPTPALVWLVNSSQIVAAAKLYFAKQTEIQQKQPQLEIKLLALFAAHLLIGTENLKENIPPKHLLLKEQKTAKAALQALCSGDGGKLKKLLKKFSSDSPFRDFANILKSLAQQQENPEAMIAAIQDIHSHSPFANLARAAGIRTLTGTALARALMQVPAADQHFIIQMMGVPTPLLDLLNKLANSIKSSQSLQALLEYPTPLTGPWARSVYLDLLVDNLGKRAAVEEHIGPFNDFENARLLALHHQQKKRRVRANTNWKQYLKLVEADTADQHRLVKLAQIHNHFATLEESSPWPSQLHIIEHLQEAQAYDPNDSRIQLRLLQWHQKGDDLKGYYQLVEQALAKFPADPKIIMLACRAAIDKKSYKKAVGLAKKAHKFDPADEEILLQQINAHMLHARQLILKSRLDLARRELNVAIKSAGGRPLDGTIHIRQALLECLHGDSDSEKKFLAAGQKLAGDGPFFSLYLVLEAGELGVASTAIHGYLQQLAKTAKTTPNKPDTEKILDLCKRRFNIKNPLVSEAFKCLNRYLFLASALDFSKKELAALCNDLFVVRQFDLLATFAKVGQKRWLGEPVFLFYQIYAKSGGETYRISDEDFFALREALPTAVRRGDDITAQRIDGLMGQSRSGSRRNIGALSPAKIPKLVEKQLVRRLKKLIATEFGQSWRHSLEHKKLGEETMRSLLLENLAESEYSSRGPFILAYLIDKALEVEKSPTVRSKKKTGNPMRQLEMDLFE